MKIGGILLIVMISFSVYANKNDEKLSLKKWGMAYCLGKYKNGEIKDDAGGARNGYFQLGGHNNDKAYLAIKNYFDMAINENKTVMQKTGKENILMHCLDAYESYQYKAVVDNQDKYIN